MKQDLMLFGLKLGSMSGWEDSGDADILMFCDVEFETGIAKRFNMPVSSFSSICINTTTGKVDCYGEHEIAFYFFLKLA